MARNWRAMRRRARASGLVARSMSTIAPTKRRIDDFDQRDDQADRHQRGEERPDLPAIAPVIADQARRRHALVVLTKRIDAGFEETEHGFGSTGTWRPKPDFGKRRERAAKPAPRQMRETS